VLKRSVQQRDCPDPYLLPQTHPTNNIRENLTFLENTMISLQNAVTSIKRWKTDKLNETFMTYAHFLNL